MLDVLVLVVRGCGSAGLPQELVTQVFPRVVQRILASDDSSVLQVSGRDLELLCKHTRVRGR